MKTANIVSIMLASALGLPAFPATSITFQVPGAINTYAVRVNNNGVVAGTYQDANQILHGFRRYSDGTIQTFDVPGALSFSVTGLNDQGEIVGLTSTQSNAPNYGYTLSASGTFTTFSPPGSATIYSASINNSGTVAGIYANTTTRIGYIMAANGTFTTFTGPQGAELDGVDAINDSGVTAGTVASATLFQRSSSGQFDIQTDGRNTASSSSALHVTGINAFNVVVGSRDYGYGYPPYATKSEYFTWDGTTVTSFLSGGPAYSGAATAINDAGVVVGSGYISRAVPSSAFIRASDGTITTFSVGSVSTTPLSINNSGVICGYTVTSSSPNQVGFLYTP